MFHETRSEFLIQLIQKAQLLTATNNWIRYQSPNIISSRVQSKLKTQVIEAYSTQRRACGSDRVHCTYMLI